MSSAGATGSSRPRASSDRRFFAGAAAVYAVLISLLTLTINAYFALGWDVTTFIAAGWSLLDRQDPFGLYAQSRAAFYWPYAYPPLHAILVALVLPLHAALPIIPESLLARVPVVAADLGVAYLLLRIVDDQARWPGAGRLAALVWLFNPVTLYQTAVQGHFESEWLLLVIAAYALAARNSTDRVSWRRVLAISACLGGAILVKQVAVLFAVPVWLRLWLQGNRRQAVASGLAATALVVAVCLPFALRSGDFIYLNTSFVAEMAVQTQSAVVWLLAFPQYLTSSVTSTVWPLRYATPILFAVAGLVSLAALAKGRDIYETGLLVSIAFFLLSPKAMGYYYVMLIPFAMVVLFRLRDLWTSAMLLAMLSWILLSPYFASWVVPSHLPLYAALGTLNSLFFVWLFFRVWRRTGPRTEPAGKASVEQTSPPERAMAGRLAGLVLGLAVAFTIPTLAQPAHASSWVSGPQGLADPVAAAVLLALVLAVAWLLPPVLSRLLAVDRRATMLAAAAYFPLTFLQFYLTLESTKVLEFLLGAPR